MKYKVGDMVQIRQWDDMEREFGIKRGNIDCCFSFVPEMREFCGRKMKIISFGRDPLGEMNFALANGRGWSFSEDMFEKIGLTALIKRRQDVKDRTESKNQVLGKDGKRIWDQWRWKY